MDEDDFQPRHRKSDNSWLWWIGGAIVLYYVLKSQGIIGTCGTDVTGTNTCLPKGPYRLPDTGGYSVQGGGIPATVWADNPNDYWDMLAAYGKMLG